MRLTTTGTPHNLCGSVIGILTSESVPPEKRGTSICFIPKGTAFDSAQADLTGYRALLAYERLECLPPIPSMDNLRETNQFRTGDIVVMEGRFSVVRSLYRPYEVHHHLFVTERCNSNCLMCSQPPKDHDDVAALTARNLELIDLIASPPPYLTITGGEPTLLGQHLFVLIERLKERMPSTELHILTNGRAFAWPNYVRQFVGLGHSNICLGIPLYADVPSVHDYIVQARGAFDQTVMGLHQAARYGIRVEIRVVLHKLTIPRLLRLAEYIYRNLTFVEHVALMGIEYTGYTPRNIQELWIDPYEYRDELEEAVGYLALRGIPVSIYNHQLCTLKPSLWHIARKSISDWKLLYLPQCTACCVKDECGGFFQWAVRKHSAHISPFAERPITGCSLRGDRHT